MFKAKVLVLGPCEVCTKRSQSFYFSMMQQLECRKNAQLIYVPYVAFTSTYSAYLYTRDDYDVRVNGKREKAKKKDKKMKQQYDDDDDNDAIGKYGHYCDDPYISEVTIGTDFVQMVDITADLYLCPEFMMMEDEYFDEFV